MNTVPLSHFSKWVFLGISVGFAAGAPPQACSQATTRIETGVLAPDDPRFGEGEHYDHYTFDGIEGQTVLLEMRSNEFDTFLQVHALNKDGTLDRNRTWFNDDFEGSQAHSRLEITLPASGSYIVYATSYEGGETGRYELTITTITGRVEAGKLGVGDDRLQTGEYFDTYEFQAEGGETVVLDLHSEQFDTYLFVRRAGDPDFGIDNDDFQGDTQRSQIVLHVPAGDVYTAFVTSFEPGEVGRYQLSINNVPPDTSLPPNLPSDRTESGSLAAGDETLSSGEYVDTYEFQGAPGQQVEVRLESHDFDPYLILWGPFGSQTDNDDFEGSTSISAIHTTLDALGTYRVGVTSYKPGSTGDYVLTINLQQPPSDVSSPDVVELSAGQTLNGTLDGRDLVIDERSADLYSFAGTAGQRLVVRMESRDFDPVLVLTDAEGNRHTFDDAGSDTRDALLDMELPRTARYRIRATSYAAGAAGGYTLRVSLGGAVDGPGPPDVPVVDGQRIFGVFVGVSDYNGDGDANDLDQGDLPFCREDAVNLHQIFIDELGMQSGDSVLLTDAQASAASIQRALTDLGRQADEDDLLFFFYSGHGGQSSGPGDLNDPDGTHETLAPLPGESILDDDLASMLSGFEGLCVVALDSCFSGGFNKDLISAPGRFGLFSSEEVVTSTTADKFRAGGHLSLYLRWALRENRLEAALGVEQEPDNPHDANEMTAFELSQFIDAMYERHVVTSKGGGADEAVDLGGNLSFQNLVTGWGGVRPGQVLFRWVE